MILYVEKPKDSKETELNKFSKVAGFNFELHIQKSNLIVTLKNRLYFYTLAVDSQKGNEENNSIYNSIKENKILRNNLTKEAKDLLHTENYKTLLKEVKEDTNKWKNFPCSWIRR